MKIYDVSMPISEGMVVYKNKLEKQPRLVTVTSGYVTETRLQLDVHGGTHVDAPLHMVVEGATIESISLERLVRSCKVLDMTHVEDGIDASHLEKYEIESGDFILFKTKNSAEDEFNFNFIYVKEDAARILVAKEVSGVGIDALGVERNQPGHPTHKTLFEGDVIIIEGLRLQEVPAGHYLMMAAPIKLVGTDASPARVILISGI